MGFPEQYEQTKPSLKIHRPALPAHGSPHEPKRLHDARVFAQGIDPNCADPEARLEMVARQLVTSYGLGSDTARSIIDEFYVPRLLVSLPDFIVGAACERYDRRSRSSTVRSEPVNPSVKRFTFVDSAEFAKGDFRPDWLVKGVLVRNQPGAIAGPSKALKTNLSLDLAISLASGTPFLGEYTVGAPTTVAIVSGESGPHTLQETAQRICAAKGFNLEDLAGKLQWCFSLPTFSDLPGMIEYTKALTDLGAQVNIIDPLYQSLGAVDARNLFEMGESLRTIGNMVLKAGATPVLVHHANGRLQTGEVMELSHLSYSGLEQYLRQWVLISRHNKYQGDGTHNLLVNIGGSAGQSKVLAVHIQEGVIDDNFGGRTWDVEVKPIVEAKEGEREDKEARKAHGEHKTRNRHDALVLDAIDAVVEKGQCAATKKDIMSACPTVNAAKIGAALARLQEDGFVTQVSFTKKTAKNVEWTGNGYQRTKFFTQTSIPDLEG